MNQQRIIPQDLSNDQNNQEEYKFMGIKNKLFAKRIYEAYCIPPNYLKSISSFSNTWISNFLHKSPNFKP